MKHIALVAAFTLGMALPLAAQDQNSEQIKARMVQIIAELAGRVPASARVGQVLGGAVARAAAPVETRFLRGAPYSAEAVTEFSQTLADGNRIAGKSVTRVYRDREGRTRREQTDSTTGTVTSVSIVDPVAGYTYWLDPVNRFAYRTGTIVVTPEGLVRSMRTFSPPTGTGSGAGIGTGAGGGGAIGGAGATGRGFGGAAAGGAGSRSVTGVVAGKAGGAAGGVAGGTRSGSGGRIGGTQEGQTTREEELQQTIEGLAARGTRTTTVIPAGAAGNAQPLRIVLEEWTSLELQVFLLTKHSDPRLGETTYRLTNIVRSEPNPSLFQVPADYTFKDLVIAKEPSETTRVGSVAHERW